VTRLFFFRLLPTVLVVVVVRPCVNTPQHLRAVQE
jgi:hypothetical protein